MTGRTVTWPFLQLAFWTSWVLSLITRKKIEMFVRDKNGQKGTSWDASGDLPGGAAVLQRSCFWEFSWVANQFSTISRHFELRYWMCFYWKPGNQQPGPVMCLPVCLTTTLGTLRSEDDDGGENVAEKVNSRSFNLHSDYSKSLTLSNVGEPS